MSFTDGKQVIIEYLSQYGYTYIDLKNDEIEYVYDALFDNIFRDDVSDIVNVYYGLHCRCVKDYENMIKYYLIATKS